LNPVQRLIDLRHADSNSGEETHLITVVAPDGTLWFAAPPRHIGDEFYPVVMLRPIPLASNNEALTAPTHRVEHFVDGADNEATVVCLGEELIPWWPTIE